MRTPEQNCSLTQFSDWWHTRRTHNRMEFICIVLSTIALGLRWTTVTFPFARLLMLIAMFLYFQCLYKVYFVNSYLGPKIILMKRMSYDLFMFLLVFIVFMVAYSISVQSLIHPNRTPYWEIGWDLFQNGIWVTFGELTDETMKGQMDDCNVTYVTLSVESLDCFLRIYPVPIFLAVYLFFGSILLVNMLIAVFTSVFDEVQNKSEEIWHYHMYNVFREFDTKPFLPPPFIILCHAGRLIQYIYRLFVYRLQSHSRKLDKDVIINKRRISKKDLLFLERFERICSQNFIYSKHSKDKRKMDSGVVQEMNDLVDDSEMSAQGNK